MHFVSFGNDEILKMEMLGSQIKCRKCGEIHEIKNGDRVNDDGSKSPSTAMQFTTCKDGTLLLVGVNGRKIDKWG